MSGASSRRKGHNYERLLAQRFRFMGWETAATSRMESRRLDDAKIDLVRTQPLAIQAKHTKIAPNMHLLLEEMQSNIENLPEIRCCYPAVYHKRTRQGETVTMRAEDFEEIIKTLVHERIW